MKNFIKILKNFILIIILICVIGCAGTGTRNRVCFNTSQYPVSLSPVIPDKNGKFLDTEQLEMLGTFKAYKRGWTTLWGFVPIGDIDFSEELNTQIKAVEGKAVVNLSIKAKDVGSNSFIFLHWFPFWPGCVKVEVDGIIVRPLSSK